MSSRRRGAVLVGAIAALLGAGLLVPPFLYVAWQNNVAAFEQNRWTESELLTQASTGNVTGVGLTGDEALASDRHGLRHAVRLEDRSATLAALSTDRVFVFAEPVHGVTYWVKFVTPSIVPVLLLGVVAALITYMIQGRPEATRA